MSWQSFEWLECWWAAFGARAELFVPTIWSADRLVAAAPMLIVRTKIKGIACRVLRFIENGITPRSNFILTPGDNTGAARLWELIAEHSCEWDLAVLANVPHDGTAIESWRSSIVQAGLKSVESPDRQSAFIGLGDGNAESYESPSKSLRRNIVTARNRLARAGNIEVKTIPGDHGVAHALEACFQISARSWKAASGSDLGGRDSRRRFYESLAQNETMRKRLYIWLLLLGERPIGFELLIRSGDTLTGLATDYDQEFKQCSPGVYLRAALIEQLPQYAIRRYDLAGQLYGYKLYWTREFLPHSQFWIFHRGMKSQLLYIMKSKLLTLIEAMKARLRRGRDSELADE